MKLMSPGVVSQYKAFSVLSMIYVTIILSADVLIYKIAFINSFAFTVGSLVTPFIFLMTDIIAEVYGYQLTRRLIWSGLLCSIIFTVICVSLIHLPSPSSWQYQSAYDQVLGKLPRVLLGYIAGIAMGAFINTYLITKWKVLFQGGFFGLRSLLASSVGQLVFTVTTLMLDMLGIIPLSNIFKLIMLSFSIKILVLILAVIPTSIFVYYLKKFENIDVYDYNTDFNPFKLSVST